MPDTLRDLCMQREQAIEAKAKQEAAPAAKKFPGWSKATPEERVAYSLEQVALVNTIADPTQGLARCAKIGKGVTEKDVGAEGYRTIMRAIGEAEKAFLPKETAAVATVVDEADPFAPDSEAPEISYLRGAVAARTTVAEIDELAKRWSEDSHSIDEPTYNAGVTLLQKARVSKEA